jgi:Ca2+-binding EF-hand superfamily protein
MFDELDKSGDNKISIDEFKKAIPILEKWGVKITDPEAEFKKIDADGGGSLFFNEFSHYCI